MVIYSVYNMVVLFLVSPTQAAMYSHSLALFGPLEDVHAAGGFASMLRILYEAGYAVPVAPALPPGRTPKL